MEPEIRKQPVRFYEIDLLRFLAALSVVFFHYTFRGYMADKYSPIPFPDIGRASRYGYLGVELFFIISGYVVLLSAQGKTVRQFFLSRVTRLYPAFWVACTLTFIVKRIWGPGPGDVQMSSYLHSGFGQYVYNMTMLHEFFGIAAVDGAYWSLTIEITFYFLIAVLIGFKLLRHLDLFLVAWLAYTALPGLMHENSPFAILFFPTYAPYFVAGMLFYLLQQPAGRTWLRYGLLVAAYLLAVKMSMAQTVGISVKYHAAHSRSTVALIITSFFVIFYLVASRKINLSRFTWLAWLGALTYPLYLLHSDIAYIAFHRIGHLVNKYVLLGVTLLIMLLAAYLIHTLIERPFGKQLGKKVDSLLSQLDSKG